MHELIYKLLHHFRHVDANVFVRLKLYACCLEQSTLILDKARRKQEKVRTVLNEGLSMKI